MLPVLLTIDTEYSSGLYARGMHDRAANFAATIACKSARGEAGIFHQMRVFAEHGLKAVFFVDPLPALVWGQGAVDDVVGPILAGGHEVQLHLHTEWLEFAHHNMVGGRTGQHIKDFPQDDQAKLIEFGIARLVEAGAPRPIAFRAGNYGASDDTLHALAACGIAWDSSFAPGFAASDCAIPLESGACAPVMRHGVAELPAAAIAGPRGGWRHGQIPALSLAELKAATRHAAAADWPALVLVSHSFELFDRARNRPNAVVKRRFEAFCAWLGVSGIARTAGFADLALPQPHPRALPLLPHAAHRTVARMAEQFVANRLARGWRA